MNNNIDWDEVEYKISLICYKFDNLSSWHEDLAQELRIHAYYVSDNYYDLYRKAIDFWRRIQTRQSPEIPYFDLEIFNKSYDEDHSNQFDDLVRLIRKELNRPGYNKWDSNMLDLANKLLDIILEDIDPKKVKENSNLSKSSLNHYINNRVNLSWVSEATGIGYKRVVAAMKFLEDTVRGLAAMNKIEIPSEYFKGFYEE
jgi:hypothetical protein